MSFIMAFYPIVGCNSRYSHAFAFTQSRRTVRSGDRQRRGGLILGHSTEKSTVDDFAQPWVELRQSGERVIQRDERLGSVFHGDVGQVEIDVLELPTAFVRPV